MKNITLLFLLFLPLTAFAQQKMSPPDMQRMMQQAGKAQECMRNIDQSTLQSLSGKAQMMEKDIQRLCKAGKRGEAMQRALQFSKEIHGNKEMAKMRKCGEMMQGMMPKIGIPTTREMKERHICDN